MTLKFANEVWPFLCHLFLLSDKHSEIIFKTTLRFQSSTAFLYLFKATCSGLDIDHYQIKKHDY